MSFLSDASLVMIPSGYKDGTLYSAKPTNGDGDFTFSRGSNLAATRINSDGVLEKGRENLLLQSNQFNTTWTTARLSSLTSGQSGYDGSNDAWSVIPNTANDDHKIYQSVSQTGIITFSVYAKANGYNGLALVSSNTNNGKFFNLSNGTLGNDFNSSPIDSTITEIGNGWYRCQVVFNVSAGNFFTIYVSSDGTSTYSFSGNETDGILIQSAQIEVGLVSTPYIETGATTAQAGILEDMPRLDYSGGATCPSLLLEPQRTNLLYYSSAAPLTTTTSASNEWVIYSGSTAVVNDAIGVDGYQNATKYINASNATSDYMLYRFLTVTSGNTYTVSGYLKLGTASNACIVLNDGTAWNTISGGNFVATASEGYDEWKRFEITFTAPSNNKLNIHIGYHNETGVTAQSLGNFYLDSFQVEAGSYSTSLIPTYGASVTRGEDVCLNGGDSSTFNDSEGVFFFQGSTLVEAGETRVISISDGSTSNNIYMNFNNNANSFNCEVISSGSTQFNPSVTMTKVNNNKIAIKYKENDFALWINGVEVATDTSGSTPTGLDRFNFDFGQGSFDYKGNVKQAIYFNSALTDDELAALTTI